MNGILIWDDLALQGRGWYDINMNNTYIIIIIDFAGNIDCELLDSPPTPSMIEGLQSLDCKWQIREGSINGGDSRLIQAG